MYIKYRYIQAVVDNFLGDEFVGAERKQPLKERMATSVKEVQKQTAPSLKAVGNAGGPFGGKKKRTRGSGWKHPAKQGGTIPPSFRVYRNRAYRPPIQSYKCKEFGHVAAICPNKG